MLNDCWGIIVGDVTGHGVGPALLMAETRAYLRVLAGRREDAGEILTRAHSVLWPFPPGWCSGAAPPLPV